MKRTDSLLRSLLVGAGILLLAGFAVPSVARADAIFNLTGDHCTGGCGTAPFGTVTLTQNGTSVGIVVDLANGPPNTVGWAQTGAGDFQLFKFNATGVVVGDITVTQTFSGQTLQANTGTLNGDGTGHFAFGVSCTTCGNGNLGITSNVVFSVANATIADLLGPNNLGNIFVADVFSSQTGNTGPVFASAPEPSTLVLYGLGLTMLLMGQKFRRARVNKTL